MAEIMISNKLTAKYDLKGFAESTIDVTLTVGVYVDSIVNVEIETKAIGVSSRQVDIDVVFADSSLIGVEISPSVISSVPVEIEVNPHNKMSVYYELTTPPTVIYESFPVQDSFVIENNPYSNINYGKNNSMIVGVDQKGKNISYVKFDTSSVPLGVTLKSAKARFYYSQLSIEGLEISKVNDNWQELGITYNNRPTNLEDLNQSYIIDEVNRFVEFDVLSSVHGWINGLANYGFALTSNKGVSVFSTREFPLSPELIVEYYSPLPFTSDISKKEIEITVARNVDSEIRIELEVQSNFLFYTVPIEIFTKQKDEIFTDDIEVEIEVPSYDDSSEIEIQISVLLDGISDIEVELEVPIYSLESNIEVQISVLLSELSEIEVELEVPFKQESDDIMVSIEVLSVNYTISEIPIELTIPYYSNSELEIEIECINDSVNYNDVIVELIIPDRANEVVEVEVEVPLYEDSSDIQIEIEVPIRLVDDEIRVSIGVWGESKSDIKFDIYCRVDYISQVEVEIEVGMSNRYAYVFMT